MKRIKVDIPAIKEYIREHGMTQADVCRRIGRGPNFLCSCTGDMAEYTYDLLIQVLSVEDGAFQQRKETASPAANRGGRTVYAGAGRIARYSDFENVFSGHGDMQGGI